MTVICTTKKRGTKAVKGEIYGRADLVLDLTLAGFEVRFSFISRRGEVL